MLRLRKAVRFTLAGTLISAGMLLSGCLTPKISSSERLAEFDKAGPIRPAVDVDRLTKARTPTGAYRVVAGDVLELRMPTVLRMTGRDSSDGVDLYQSRVSDTGTLHLPIVGQLPVAGKTLSEVESAIIAAYHPRYVVHLPSVVVSVAEHHTVPVSVLGAVKEPGVYKLRSDEMSLVALLMRAGGIDKAGATTIRIRGGGEVEKISLPVKGSNVPFADVVLRGGETVEVERLDPQVFVMGLVKKPGSFLYPSGVTYNLLQALALAGGVEDYRADPHYARVYRQSADDRIVSAIFKIAGKDSDEMSNVLLKHGDVVYVQQTARTRVRQMIADLFLVRMSAGLHAGAVYSPATN